VVFVDEPGGSYWRDWETWVRSHLAGRRLVSEHDHRLFRITDDAGTAVHEILNFYSNYHSSRFVADRLVLRLRLAPSEEQLEALNRDFSDLLIAGRIDGSGPLPQEGGEFPQLARLALQFNHREMGRLRMLIDALNGYVTASAPPPRDAGPLEVPEQKLPPEAEQDEQD
jgi:hypothetical protein